MKRIIAMMIVSVLMSGSAFANTLNSTNETRQLADKIVDHFVKKEFKEGLALAKPHWPLPEVEIDGLANQITTQWPIVDQRFGVSTGKEFIREEKLGNSFIRYYYLHKFQNHAIYWLITFYRPTDKWKVNGVNFKDELESLFQ